MLVRDIDGGQRDGAATRHVLQRREREAVSAELGGRRMRIGFEMRAGVHGHAELRKQQRQRQPMDDQRTVTSNQAGPPQQEYGRGQSPLQLTDA